MDARPRLPRWKRYAWVNIPRSGVRIKPVSTPLSVWSLGKTKTSLLSPLEGLIRHYLKAAEFEFELFLISCPVSQAVGLDEAVQPVRFVHVNSYM